MRPDADRLRAMADEGFSQADIARQLGVSQSTVSRMLAAGQPLDEVGPVQGAVEALLAQIGPLTAEQEVRAAIVAALAERLDAARRNGSGAAGFASATVARELAAQLAELGRQEAKPDRLDELVARRARRRGRVRAEHGSEAA